MPEISQIPDTVQAGRPRVPRIPELRRATWWPVAAVFGLLLCQAVILSFVRTGTSFDGAEQLLYTQTLELGYGRSQPPLYTWLLRLFQVPFGVTCWLNTC